MRFTLLLIMLSGSLGFAQPAKKAVEDTNLNLNDRYNEMKSGSQTFKDYKVIKESILDGVWKITSDSISKKEKQLEEANAEINNLQGELKAMQGSMQAQQSSIQDVIYDSTHISVLGIPFTKGFFILFVVAIVGALSVGLSVSFARVKIANGLMKEKTLIADSISHELEDFKKKAMEKQTKLSRELQNERNKWMEARKG